MKRNKYTKVISFILVIMVILSTTALAQDGYSVMQQATAPVISLPADTVKGQLDASIQGNTYTNLLGSEGDFENISSWDICNLAHQQDMMNKLFGNNGIKLTANNSNTEHFIDYPLTTVKPNSYYLFSAYVNTANCGAWLRVIRQDSVNFLSGIYMPSGYQRIAVKIATASTNYLLLRVQMLKDGVAEFAGTNETMNVDGVMINEITENECNNLSVEQLMQKYPFINCTKSTLSARIKLSKDGNVSEAYMPADLILHKLPNGTVDEFNLVNGEFKKTTGYKVLQTNDIIGLVRGTNIDFVSIAKPEDYSEYNSINNINGSMILSNSLGDKAYSDNVENINYLSMVTSTHVAIIVEKGKYSSLVEAQADLIGKSLTYQLTQPQITKLNTTPLICYPNGTVIIEPAVKDTGLYKGRISIANTSLPIKTLESVNKIVNGTRIPVSLNNVTVAPDGLSFTIAGAVERDSYEYVYLYPSELTTLPTLEYSVPVSQEGQMSGNTDMIGRHSELIDLILEQIQLLQQEIQDLKNQLNQ